MKEQYVFFETAKLANEKGFKQIEEKCYDPLCMDVNHIYDWWNERGCSTEERMKRLIPAPTQELLKKWLREVKNIHVNPVPYNETADRSNEITGYYIGEIMTTDGKMLSPGDGNYPTYEETLEKGLQIGLNHIE